MSQFLEELLVLDIICINFWNDDKILVSLSLLDKNSPLDLRYKRP